MLVKPGLEPVTQSRLEVADANPTELKRKHQVEAAYHAPPPKLSGVLTPRDLTLIKFYLWKGLMGERVEIACSLTLYFLFREVRTLSMRMKMAHQFSERKRKQCLRTSYY